MIPPWRSHPRIDRWTSFALLFFSQFAFFSMLLGGLGVSLSAGWVFVLTLLVAWRSRQLSRKAFSIEDLEPMAVRRSGNSLEWGIAFFLFCLIAFELSFYIFELKGSFMIRSSGLSGDWPQHLHLIRYFEGTAGRPGPFWPRDPMNLSEPLTGAFGLDWVTALFSRAGVPLGFLVLGTSLLLLAVTALELMGWFGVSALFVFFLAGSHLPFSRDLWLAFPIGVFLFRHLFLHVQRPAGLTKKQKEIWGSLWAVLPFFHFPTFLMVTAVALALALRPATPNFLFPLLRRAWVPAIFLFYSSSADWQGSVDWIQPWLSLVAAAYLIQILPRYIGREVVPILVLVMSLPGAGRWLAGRPSSQRTQVLWTRESEESLRRLLRNVPLDQEVAVAPAKNHPVHSTGHPFATVSDVSSFGGQYFLWGPEEKSHFGNEKDLSLESWTAVARIGTRTLYFRSSAVQ